MGNAIWVFIGIAIIQAIVGGIAKSAEKRKKAEAAQRMLEASRDGGRSPATTDATSSTPARMAVAGDPRGKSNGSAQRRLEELRKKRLEVLRRRSGPDAGVTAAVDPNPRRASTTVAKPPPPSAPIKAARPTSRTPAPVAVVQETRSSMQAARAPQPPRSEPRTADSGRRSTHQQAHQQVHESAHKSVHKAGHPSGSYGSARSRSRSSAKRLRGLLRTPTGFREALLLGELLKPPVGLRSPQGEAE